MRYSANLTMGVGVVKFLQGQVGHGFHDAILVSTAKVLSPTGDTIPGDLS
jgi:hypothetical protein